MAIPKQTKTLTFNLSSVPVNKRKETRDKLAEAIISETKKFTSKGNSPVEGEGKFQKLSIKYADEQKGGRRKPDLRLSRKMMRSLEYNAKGTKDVEIEWGIFDDEQDGKSEGHNQFNKAIAKDNMPQRRFIPDKDQDLHKDIRKKLDKIISGASRTFTISTTKKKEETPEQRLERIAEESRQSTEIDPVSSTLELDIDQFIINEILGLRDGQ